jgi:hypothetical protein
MPELTDRAVRTRPTRDEEPLPADLQLTADAATYISAAFATILDDEPLPRDDQERWADTWNEIAEHLRTTGASPRVIRRSAYGAFVLDASNELAAAASEVGLDPERFGHWLRNESESSLRDLPATGLAREVIALKLSNNTATWRPNDLTDLFYLVQAAGYADAVVGEKGFTELIRQGQRRLGRPTNAYRSIVELCESGFIDGLEAHPPPTP